MTDARMNRLMGKLNMGSLRDSERMILTSTLKSGALILDMQEERVIPDEQDSSQSALVKRLEAALKLKTEELQREKKLVDCLGLLRQIDWSLLSYSDWHFAADALTAGCRSCRAFQDLSSTP